MNCTQAKKFLMEVSTNLTENDLVCCDSCHDDADEGFNEFLAAGGEPCCELQIIMIDHGLSWYEE